jgi:hypothetical protein
MGGVTGLYLLQCRRLLQLGLVGEVVVMLWVGDMQQAVQPPFRSWCNSCRELRVGVRDGRGGISSWRVSCRRLRGSWLMHIWWQQRRRQQGSWQGKSSNRDSGQVDRKTLQNSKSS